MASQKKLFNQTCRNFTKLAFEQAKIHIGSTGKNPSVGCIAVKKNSVISSGNTSMNGRPHAEFNCLNKNINFAGADLYITLEPCSHKGLTPACTNIIIKKKIKRVFFFTF
jgi:diaminohydroxyphosphoribosylaminopyrimidine deaminase/5-amino-6-(5-phosphoribosylamino)uracil reductase